MFSPSNLSDLQTQTTPIFKVIEWNLGMVLALNEIRCGQSSLRYIIWEKSSNSLHAYKVIFTTCKCAIKKGCSWLEATNLRTQAKLTQNAFHLAQNIYFWHCNKMIFEKLLLPLMVWVYYSNMEKKFVKIWLHQNWNYLQKLNFNDHIKFDHYRQTQMSYKMI